MIKENIKEIRDIFPKAINIDKIDGIKRIRQPTIGYKAAFIYYKNGKLKPCIVKLLIPAGARYTFYRDESYEKYGKHRCTCAQVIGFLSYYTGKEIKVTKAYSIFYNWFCYELGKVVRPTNFSIINSTCAGGIHYFNSLEAARCYIDSILCSYKYEFRKRELRSHAEWEDSQIPKIANIEQRKNMHPIFTVPWI